MHTTRRRLLRILPVLFGCLGTSADLRSQSTVPEEIRRRLIEIEFSSPYGVSEALYLPLLAAGPRDGIEVTKDVAYGEAPRNLLDVYRPAEARNAPIFVYVHGGGYGSGDRDINDEVYGNVLYYFAQQGMLGINATYRLAPDASWPSGAEDMRGVIEWIREHAADYGGDPSRIYMMGHSAGATHVATYAFDPRFHPAGGHGLSGIVLISGRYTIKWDPDDQSLEGIRLYFGDDPTAYPSQSVITHVPDSDVPVMLVIAQFDQRNLVETSGELFVALCERDDGRCPRFLQLKYHNHMSEVLTFNTSDDYLGREIMEFIRPGPG